MKTRSLLLLLCLAQGTHAESSLSEWWAAHGDYRIQNLSYFQTQRYAEIPLNQNNFLNLPEDIWVNEFRPEFSLSYERAYFSVAPRYTARRETIRDGALKGTTNNSTETYLHEWLAQFFILPELSVSYGREDLQWGPSFLLSPSNPFDSRNGRTEPKSEVNAADYAKIIWTPNYNWTISGIVSTDDGRKDYRVRSQLRQDFRDIYALKVDYLFDGGQASVIASTTDDSEDEDNRLGFYGSYNLNEAWIAYLEGSLSTEDEEMLVGASYTTEGGLNLSAEYFYNSSGIDDAIPKTLGGLVNLASFITSIPNRESFSREHYMLLQAYKNDVIGDLDVIVRYTQNLDDDSRSLLGHFEIELNDYASLFTSGTINSSGGGELDSLREYWVQAGIELNF